MKNTNENDRTPEQEIERLSAEVRASGWNAERMSRLVDLGEFVHRKTGRDPFVEEEVLFDGPAEF